MNNTPPDPTAAMACSTLAPEPNVLLLEVLREMRGQRESFDIAQQLVSAERRSERRWRIVFQALVFGTPLVLGIVYFLFFLSTAGFRWGPFGDVVGLVQIEGTIAAGEPASADHLVPLLHKAFTNDHVKAVVLSIDSPGGAPVEAERIYTTIDTLKRQHPKPVVAVINNLGASAAYMIALHADKIVVGKYSLVGSIGAVMAPWRLDRAIARFDVAQKVYASGKLKAFLNPFTPVTPEVEAKAQGLVNQMGAQFLSEVKASRGERLAAHVDYGSGEVWPGPEAKALGLVDDISTLDEYILRTWGIASYDFGPTSGTYALFSKAAQNAITSALQGSLSPTPSIQ